MANELERSKRIVIDPSLKDDINPENMRLYQKYKRDMQMRELSVKTIHTYECDILAWFRWIVQNQYNPNIKDLTTDEIEEFIFFCKEEGNHTERIKGRMAALSAFYKFLRKKKEIKENPMEFMDRPKKGLPVIIQTFLTPKQVESIREFLKEEDDLQLTTYAEFSLATMARVNAVSNITWEQIDFENMVVNDVLEKENKIVTLFFDEYVRELLLKLKAQREKDGIDCKYVFITKYAKEYSNADTTTLDSWTKKIGKAIGVPSLHPHDWRHSGATLRKNAGMTLEMVSSLLNHAGVDVTRQHYIKEDKSKLGSEFRKYKI